MIHYINSNIKLITIFHLISKVISGTNPPPDINGVYFTNNPAGQANFEYNNFDNSVKQAINAGFNRVYIGSYDYQQLTIGNEPKTDVLLNWSDLSSSKVSSVKNLASSKNSKICMIVRNIEQIFLGVNDDEFVAAVVSTTKKLKLDCVVFDLRLNEAGYPINSKNPSFLDFVLKASEKVCGDGFNGNVVHLNYARNLGNFMSEPLYGGQPKFPTLYADTINSLTSCLESVNLDYFIESQPDFQTDQKSLFQNSTGLTYSNADYGGTAIGEITENNNIDAGLLVMGKPLPYMNPRTDPDKLACWRDDVPYAPDQSDTNEIAGFVTWPFATQSHSVTALDWAEDIRYCGHGPVTVKPPPAPSGGSVVIWESFYLHVLWAVIYYAGF